MKKAILLLFLAGPAWADTTLEIGMGWASGDPGNAAVVIGERSEKYGVSMGIIETHFVRADGQMWRLDRNMFIDVQRHWRTPNRKWELSLGPSYFQNTNRALATHFNWSVAVKYWINEDIGVIVRHFSNSGSGEYNMGHEILAVHMRF